MKTCLVVDDIAFNRKRAMLVIEKAGFKAEEAACANDIGKFVDSENYSGVIDCILLDLNMPGIDGSTFMALIKGSAYEKIPIFLFSAEQDDVMKKVVQETGAKGYLPKGFTEEMLQKAMAGIKNKKTCLIVDDMRFNRMAAAKILQNMDFDTEEAKNAAEVGMYFEPMSSKTIENIDVVLVDWHMPTIEGPKVIELIRQQASSIPIFLYTASNNSAEGRKLAEIAGANGYIDKNLTKEKLETAFREKGII